MSVKIINQSNIIGQQFDKNGIRQQWWTDESMTAFRGRQQCFVDQYSQFTNEGAQVCCILPIKGSRFTSPAPCYTQVVFIH